MEKRIEIKDEYSAPIFQVIEIETESGFASSITDFEEGDEWI